jgi:hypothetical protein
MTATERRALITALQCLTAPTLRQESEARALARQLLLVLQDADAVAAEAQHEALMQTLREGGAL